MKMKKTKINSSSYFLFIKNLTSNLNITLGTSNKKNPEVIYTALTTYITPLSEDFDEEFLLKFDKKSWCTTILKKVIMCTTHIHFNFTILYYLIKTFQQFLDLI